ncbi:inner membrane protein [Cyclonatronum proteinivorum]|uniref:Inner membrane protein n=1 Tax=Cyclonatronum proteinivorum TaxID=1457365 RepID=A0A345ULK1_9BACT|nr:metal-dependent hydrolase [Cyclonatronum proteinivorum]AXJ01353.1 inner membrane protein [Cyclonatronum proteinivorum]
MDSLTHILLGAAIGESVLGKHAGKKALFWGAAAATAPDLDVLVGAFMSDLDKLIFHRGLTHSLMFILLTSPLYGWLISRIHRNGDVNWRQWTLLVFLAQLTHTLLDSFTSYGTQLYLPFIPDAIALSTISVVDPLFTLPLLLTVPWLIFAKRNHPLRRRISSVAIFLATAYLTFTVINKTQVERAFHAAYASQGYEVTQTDIKPTLFNNLLWRGIAQLEGEDRYVVGYFSVVDGQRDIVFEEVEGHHDKIAAYHSFRSVQRLRWVSEGFYQVEETESGFLFNDLRFGRVAEFSDDVASPYAFSYQMTRMEDESDFLVERVRLRVERGRESESFRLLWQRIQDANAGSK